MAALHEQDNDRNQQQKAAGEGEEKELDRGIDAVRSAPDPDDQVHGNQHHFPEDIEQDHVEGAENPDHRGFHNQQGDHEFADPGPNSCPGGDHADRREQRGEQDEPQTDAVDSERIVDRRGPNPLGHLGKLHAMRHWVEPRVECERQAELRRRCPECHVFDVGIVLEEGHDRYACRRQKNKNRQ